MYFDQLFKQVGVLMSYCVSGITIAAVNAGFEPSYDKDMLLWIVVLFTFLPELLMIFSPNFRKWIKDGVEDSDGEMSKQDLKDLIAHYSSLWCIRIFVLASALSMLKGIEVNNLVLSYSFAGAIGFESAVLVRKFINMRTNFNKNP